MDGWANSKLAVPALCRGSSSRALHTPSDRHIGTPKRVPGCTLHGTAHGLEALRPTEAMVSLVADDPDRLQAIARTVASAGWSIETYLSGEALLRAYDPDEER